MCTMRNSVYPLYGVVSGLDNVLKAQWQCKTQVLSNNKHYCVHATA